MGCAVGMPAPSARAGSLKACRLRGGEGCSHGLGQDRAPARLESGSLPDRPPCPPDGVQKTSVAKGGDKNAHGGGGP